MQFAAPEDGQGGVRGTLDLVFRVAGGWKIVDYQNETQSERAALEAGARIWQKLAGEPVVKRGVWHTEAGIW